MSGVREVTLSNQASAVMGTVIANQLSEDSKAKLRALGIRIETVKSEAEAKRIIETQNAEQAKKEENAKKQQSQNLSERTLYFKLTEMAKKLGINSNGNSNIGTMVNDIALRLENLSIQAKYQNDPAMSALVSSLNKDFFELRTTANLIRRNLLMLTDTLDSLANTNKALLGLR